MTYLEPVTRKWWWQRSGCKTNVFSSAVATGSLLRETWNDRRHGKLVLWEFFEVSSLLLFQLEASINQYLDTLGTSQVSCLEVGLVISVVMTTRLQPSPVSFHVWLVNRSNSCWRAPRRGESTLVRLSSLCTAVTSSRSRLRVASCIQSLHQEQALQVLRTLLCAMYLRKEVCNLVLNGCRCLCVAFKLSNAALPLYGIDACSAETYLLVVVLVNWLDCLFKNYVNKIDCLIW